MATLTLKGLVSFGDRLLQVIFLALPPLSLAIMAVAWIHYGIDLPTWDDWRNYVSGRKDSLQLDYLFKPENDTLYPVGKVLDALAQRFIGGNSVGYQLITMLTVLGSILWLQWRLLLHALEERFFAATAFATSLFAIQPYTYWGQQDFAYHQTIPVVCLLAALTILLLARWHRVLKVASLMLVGTVSGFSYISGALSILAAAITLLIACVLRKDLRTRLLAGSLALLVAGIGTSVVQLWAINVTKRATIWSLPDNWQFYAYLLGKISRALMLPASMPLFSLAATILLLVSSLVLLIVLLTLFIRRLSFDKRVISVFVTALPLFAAVAVYLLMVAAARSHFRSPSNGNFLDYFVSGYGRFHFFWVVVLFPWMLAVGIVVLDHFRLKGQHGWAACVIAVLVGAISQGAMSHDAAFREIAGRRKANDIPCLMDALVNRSGIVCPTLWPKADLLRGYAFAVVTDASFVKYFPVSLRAKNSTLPTYSILSVRPSAYSVANAEVVAASPNRIDLTAGNDVMIIFRTGHPEAISDCSILLVSTTITASNADWAQLFYMVPGQKASAWTAVITKNLPANQVQSLDFLVTSRSGFQDRFRLDPVASAQASKVGPITLKCLLPRPND